MIQMKNMESSMDLSSTLQQELKELEEEKNQIINLIQKDGKYEVRASRLKRHPKSKIYTLSVAITSSERYITPSTYRSRISSLFTPSFFSSFKYIREIKQLDVMKRDNSLYKTLGYLFS